jgi:cytoskeleton protein RodZ
MSGGLSMSEAWGHPGEAGFAGQAANDGVTAGVLLRRAREAAGLHVAALAVALKVPVRKLEALEEDRYDVLTDAVFVRALASSVCRTLKIDPQPVLERLPQTSVPRLARHSEGLNAPFRAPNDGAQPTWIHFVTRPVSLAVFGLLLGALILVLLPARQEEGSTTADLPAAPGVPPAAAPAEPAVSLAPPSPPATAMMSPAATAAPLPVAPVAAASAPVPVATSASGIVVFKTKAPSWVEVTDANGVVAVRKLLAAGEAVGASGALPLQVTIGRVDSTEVQVRGKPFDLRPVSRDNVARFEVK